MKHIGRFALTGMLAAATQSGWAASASPAAAASVTCQAVTVPVALAAGAPADQEVWAEYCLPAAGAAGAVAVLVPGGTYDHAYFDWPQYWPVYSYAAKTLAAGRAVLDIDRLGTGESSHPASTSLTVQASAFVLHQVITYARGLGYRQVDLIGHSLGSIIAVQDAGTWPADPSRLVLTGLLHVVTPNQDVALGDFYPAGQDPAFAGLGYDTGYLTTMPGTRGPLFYSAAADPSVIAYDEEGKDVMSATEMSSALASWRAPADSSISDSITAPVLETVGRDDFLFCQGGSLDCADQAALYRNEAPYFAAATSLSFETVPDTGHDLALHPSADTSFEVINTWLSAN